MIYAKDIFQRASVRGLAEYLLYEKSYNDPTESYDTRMDNAFNDFDKDVEKYCSDNQEKISNSATNLTRETSEIYTEIGLQAGFLIMMDMMKNAGLSIEKNEEQVTNTRTDEIADYLFTNVTDALKLLDKKDTEQAKELLLHACGYAAFLKEK